MIPRVTRNTATERHYPCEACGADLTFAPGQDRLVCAHCGHEQRIPTAVGRGQAVLREIPLEQGLRRTTTEIEEHRTVSCPNCGATIEFSDGTHATRCPFCATPVVTDTGTTRHIKPQGVLPFAITEEQARDALAKWLGSLWFAPSDLAQYARKGRRMTGVYAPFWTFDARSRTQYLGQRGDIYYETRTVQVMVDGRPQTRTEQVQQIRWTPVGGQVARDFDDVLIYAAKSLRTDHVDGLSPWDLSALRDYRTDYLSGFSAESYTIELADGHAAGRNEMLGVIQSDIHRDIGGDRQRITEMAPVFTDETFKHVLLPIWTAAYRFKGRAFTFVVNAQTGQVQGERPWSMWKIGLAVVAVLIVAGIVYYVGGR